MIRFLVPDSVVPAGRVDLAGAYMVGSEGVPIRAEIEAAPGEMRCKKRVQGPASLNLLWPVDDGRQLMLETTRVPERDRPYNLTVELARARLMRISQKREDWGLFDYPGGDELYSRVDEAKAVFIRAVTAADDAEAARLGQQALQLAIQVGEALSLFHAGVFLDRRRQSRQFASRPLGCGVSPHQREDAHRARLAEAFDFAVVPVSWRAIEAKQSVPVWDQIDPWVSWAARHKLPVRGAPLVSFDRAHLPDWLVLYEHDFDAVRDLIIAHVRRTVQRLGGRIHAWSVVSGIHAHNAFNFTFEQLMELTRLCTVLVKQLAPRSTTLVDLVAPWGEYYARNPRTIPPVLFADMAVQSGISFDAFGLQFYFGVPQDGMFVRDMMQVSAMIDRFANFGKPLHITAVQVPSAMDPDPSDAWRGTSGPAGAGLWRGPWTEALQAEWLKCFVEVALSKPFVESVAWRDLADGPGHHLPHGGLLHADGSAKPAYHQLLNMRTQLFGSRTRAASAPRDKSE